MIRSGRLIEDETPKSPEEILQAVEKQKSSSQKLVFLDNVLPDLIFTHPSLASELLQTQANLDCIHDFPDHRIRHFLNLGFLHNQKYAFTDSIEVYRKAAQLIDEYGNISQQISVLIDLSAPLINIQSYGEAIDCLNRAKRLLQINSDDGLLARVWCREAYMDLHLKNENAATQTFLNAERILSRQESAGNYHDCYFLNLVQSGLGRLAEISEEWEKSLMYYHQVVKRLLKDGLHSRLCWHYLNIGRVYYALDNFDMASIYFHKAIEEKVDDSSQARASAFANLGLMENNLGHLEKAIDLYEKAEEIFRSQSAPEYFNLSNILRWKAKAMLGLGRGEEGLQLLMDSHTSARQAEDFKLLAEIYKDLSNYFAQHEDYKNAYEYQLLHERNMEKHTENYNRNHKIEVEVRYETEKKRQEAEVLKLRATQLQLKALRAQMNPHFLYNALNAIQHYITSHDVKFATKYLAEFANLIRKSLEYSDEEIISLEKEVEFLDDYLYINQKLRFEDRLDYEIIVDEDLEDDILGVPTMIVQPYVENSIEHGLRSREKGKISVRFKMLDEDTIICEIEDNGIGRDAALRFNEHGRKQRPHRSMGTRITENRLELLHDTSENKIFVQTIDLRDEKTGFAAGTKVIVQIPVVEVQIR